MRVSREGVDAPIGDNDAEEREGDRDGDAEARAPGVVEADVADADEAVVEGDEQERNVHGDEPGILEEAALDDFERQPFRRSHLGREMLHPEVHDQQHEQGCPRDALQVPVDGASGHGGSCQWSVVSRQWLRIINLFLLGDLCGLCGFSQ